MATILWVLRRSLIDSMIHSRDKSLQRNCSRVSGSNRGLTSCISWYSLLLLGTLIESRSNVLTEVLINRFR